MPKFDAYESITDPSKDFNGFPTDMYNISGSPDIDDRSYARYLKCKEQDRAIQDAAQYSFRSLKKVLNDTNEESRITIIKDILYKLNIDTKTTLWKLISTLSDKTQEQLFTILLQASDEKLLLSGLRGISKVPDEVVFTVCENILFSGNYSMPIQNTFVDTLSSLKPDVCFPIVKRIIEDPNIHNTLKSRSLEKISKCSDSQIFELITIALQGAPSSSMLEKIYHRLHILANTYPDDIKYSNLLNETITSEVSSENIQSRIYALKMMYVMLSDQDRERYVSMAIGSYDLEQAAKNTDVLLLKLQALPYIPENERYSLVNLALKIGNDEAITLVFSMLIYLKEDESSKVCEEVIRDERLSAKTKRYAINSINHLQVSEILTLAKFVLNSNDEDTQQLVTSFFNKLPTEAKETLIDEIIDRGLGQLLIQPILYNSSSNEKFARKEFEKDGSRTVLVEGALKGKSIIRYIQPDSFIAWERAYEAHELWKQGGFEYVPVEPIQSFHLNSDGLVEVFSGVLDTDAEKWQKMTSRHKQSITQQIAKIKSFLKQTINISHGHDFHDGNFCLRFFRNRDGIVDFTTPPRVYIIDFDAAMFIF